MSRLRSIRTRLLSQFDVLGLLNMGGKETSAISTFLLIIRTRWREQWICLANFLGYNRKSTSYRQKIKRLSGNWIRIKLPFSSSPNNFCFPINLFLQHIHKLLFFPLVLLCLSTRSIYESLVSQEFSSLFSPWQISSTHGTISAPSFSFSLSFLTSSLILFGNRIPLSA